MTMSTSPAHGLDRRSMRPAQQNRLRDASELDIRLDWWLREHGQPPTYDALRDLNRHQHPWAAHNRRAAP